MKLKESPLDYLEAAEVNKQKMSLDCMVMFSTETKTHTHTQNKETDPSENSRDLR